MQIDEKQEKFDLSDHNLIETTLKRDCDHINYQRRESGKTYNITKQMKSQYTHLSQN